MSMMCLCQECNKEDSEIHVFQGNHSRRWHIVRTHDFALGTLLCKKCFKEKYLIYFMLQKFDDNRCDQCINHVIEFMKK